MNDAKEKRITRAAGIAVALRVKMRALGVQTMPEDFEEAKKQAIAFALAQAELYEAEFKLNEEIRSN